MLQFEGRRSEEAQSVKNEKVKWEIVWTMQTTQLPTDVDNMVGVAMEEKRLRRMEQMWVQFK